jgi:DNA polymerase
MGRFFMTPDGSMDLGDREKPELVISSLEDLPFVAGGLEKGSAEKKRKRMDSIARDVTSCTECPLHKTRKNAVPGSGSQNAKLMLVGEAPGREEDEDGLPFVGRAGRILDEALHDAGLDRDKVFITSILKCRPPKNRNPKKKEIEACRQYLLTQIECIKPNAILAMGNFGLLGLLGKRLQVSKVRGDVLQFTGIPVIPTYHPAACLRNPRLGKPFRTDLRKALRRSQ